MRTTHYKALSISFFISIIQFAPIAFAQVGAPPASCWIPQSQMSQFFVPQCATGACGIILPAGLGVCVDEVVMVPVVGSHNGGCAISIYGELPGAALKIPASYANPNDPYSAPTCAAPAPQPTPSPIDPSPAPVPAPIVPTLAPVVPVPTPVVPVPAPTPVTPITGPILSKPILISHPIQPPILWPRSTLVYRKFSGSLSGSL